MVITAVHKDGLVTLVKQVIENIQAILYEQTAKPIFDDMVPHMALPE
jgi:hypothetical protein